MRHKQLKLCALLFIGLGLKGLQAQETISATGGNTTGSGGSVSFSAGQVIYTTNSGSNGTVSQGVQQPFEISVVTELEDAKGINLTVLAYPNPATEFVMLKIDASATISIQTMLYQLFDSSGKLLESKKIEGNETSIGVKNLPPSTYFIKVSVGNKQIKSFKIVKN